MAEDTARVYVGTIGQSVWRSEDGGLKFKRCSQGLFSECHVRALVLDPSREGRLYAGTDRGLYRSKDRAETWAHLASPMDGRQIWSLAIDAEDSCVLYAGTCPAGLFRTRDGGVTWDDLDADLPDRCVGTLIIPRITCILIDPTDRRRIYAGVEIGGARVSEDGGDTWRTLTRGLSSQDIHGLVASPRAPKTLLASTNNDVNRSTDGGDTWTPLGVGRVFPWPYCRVAAAAPDDADLVYVGAGSGPPGDAGALYRTRDRGETWERMDLPIPPNSTIWNLGFNRADPTRLYAGSINGQLYRSLDSGTIWEKLPQEFGEVRALAWAPAG